MPWPDQPGWLRAGALGLHGESWTLLRGSPLPGDCLTLVSLSLSGCGFPAGSCGRKVLSVDLGFIHRGARFGAGDWPQGQGAARVRLPAGLQSELRPGEAAPICANQIRAVWKGRRQGRGAARCARVGLSGSGLGDKGRSMRARGLDWVPGSFLLFLRDLGPQGWRFISEGIKL